MHPEEIEVLEEATAGERKVFRFLHDAARPDRDFIAWYEPTISSSGTEPDFILYGNSIGLLVLEVKDWEIDQIGKSTPHVQILDWRQRRNPDQPGPAGQIKYSPQRRKGRRDGTFFNWRQLPPVEKLWSSDGDTLRSA